MHKHTGIKLLLWCLAFFESRAGMCLAFCSISAREAAKGQQQDYVKGLINVFVCPSLPQSCSLAKSLASFS
jgi:hypothetical protein